MTVRSERLVEYKDQLIELPNNIVLTRAEAIKDIELAEEMLPVLGTPITRAVNLQRLTDIAYAQAQIRALCQGARTSDVLYFNYTISTNNADLTFPTADTFGVQIISSDGTYEIELSNDPDATMTVIEDDGTVNTFSTFFGNYYFVQSRQSGSLIAATDSEEINSIITPTLLDEDLEINPDLPGTVFGEELPFGTVDLTEVLGTWNENYITNYISGIYTKDDATFVTLARTLSDGLSSTWSRPELYVPLILKRAIADGTEDNPLRMHTPFAVAVVVTEGMKLNTSWLPVGDNNGNYNDYNASVYSGTEINQNAFNDKLGIFDPSDLEFQQDSILLSCQDLESNTFESSTGIFPYVNILPHFPEVQNHTILQASIGYNGVKLEDTDLFLGRYLYIENGKTDNSGTPLPNYRYIVDSAAKYYYKANTILQLPRSGTYAYDTDVGGTTLNFTEPQVEFHSEMDDLISDTLQLNGGTPTPTQGGGYVDSTKLAKVQNYFCPVDFEQNPGATLKLYNRFHITVGTGNSEYIPAISSGSSGSGGVDFKVHQFTSNGVYQYTTSTSSQPANTSSFYYILQTPSNGQMYVDKYRLDINYYSDSSGNTTSYYTSASLVSVETRLGHYFYNDVNEFIISPRWSVLANMISTLKQRIIDQSQIDPYFEQSSSPYNAGYTTHNSFKSSLQSLYTAYTNYLGYHSDFITYVTNNLNFVRENGYSYDESQTSYYQYYLDFLEALDDFNPHRLSKINLINSRIGVPVYDNVAQNDPNDFTDAPKTYKRISYVPTRTSESASVTSVEYPGITPYGTTIYEAANLMLGEDVGYIIRVFEKLRQIYYVYQQIIKTRHKYEMLSGRSKQNYP